MPTKASLPARFAGDAARTLSRAENIATLAKLLSQFQQITPAPTLDQMILLLVVGSRPGITTTALALASGIGRSSISRNTAALSLQHRKGYRGHDLIEAEADPREPRRYRYYLTARGQKLMSVLLSIVDKDRPGPAPVDLDDCDIY